MRGFLRLLSVVGFFGLCLGAWKYTEDHQSTTRKENIAKLEQKVEELRSEVVEISNKRNALRLAALDFFPDATSCPPAECEETEFCDEVLSICIAKSDEEQSDD